MSDGADAVVESTMIRVTRASAAGNVTNSDAVNAAATAVACRGLWNFNFMT
jgi:hypothetical protein